MHSLNHVALGRATAGSRSERSSHRVEPERWSDRPPPNPPVRARVAYATGRVARRLDREMARRATV